MRIVTVVGARPQFIKAAAVSRAIGKLNGEQGPARIDERIVHTGQHYDANLSAVFFEELEIPRPAHELGVGGGTHAWQTAAMLERLEPILRDERPDWVMVYGDTNSTLAGALAAAKLGLRVAHVEAGLRSFNPGMAEEVNRILTDRLSAALFCPTARSVANLAAEGIREGVYQSGDVMYDSALFCSRRAGERSDVPRRLGLTPKEFVVATVHRAENADDAGRLGDILAGLGAAPLPVVWPLHPRTRARLRESGRALPAVVRAVEPVTYLEMLALLKASRAVVTDSGGLQKEAFFLGVPCVTVREETEWVELVQAGWNRVVGTRPADIAEGLEWAMAFGGEVEQPALYGDGRAAERIVRTLAGVSGAAA